MYADRNNRRLNPAGAGAALAVSAAMFAAMINLTPNFIKHIDPPFTGYPVNADPPPPPPLLPKPVEKVTDAPKPLPDLFTPKPIILPPIPLGGATGTSDPQPTVDPYVQPSSGGGDTVVVDPPRTPVMTGAEPDPRAEFQPEYPPDMRRAGIEGQVVVRVLIGTDGRVKAIEQVRSPSDSFFNATRRQALSRWRFKPATVDGVAVEKWRQMTLRFSLTDG